MRTLTRNSGFTIVELIVVIAILGILTTIGIISYGAWRDSVEQSAIKSDLTTAANAMESERNFSDGYPSALPDSFTPSEHVTITWESGDATYFCLEGSSDQTETTFYLYSKTIEQGPLEGTCLDRPDLSPPDVPEGLTLGTVTSSSVDLSWDSVSDTESYVAQCASDLAFIQNVKQSELAHPTTTVTISGYSAGMTFFCRAKAVNNKGNSSWTAVVTGNTSTTTPTGLAASYVSPGRVLLLWTQNSANSYSIQYDTSSSFTTPTQIDNIKGNDHVLSNLWQPRYYFRVRAANPPDVSGWSTSVNSWTSITNGLVAWWPLNGNYQDVSGNGRNATSSTGSTSTGQNGVADNARTFASGQGFSLSSAPSVAGNLTYAAWVRPTSYPSERSTLIVSGAAGGGSYAYFMSLNSDGSLQSYGYTTSSPGYHSAGAGTVPLNQWTYAVVTWNGTQAKLYVNGVLRTTVASTGGGNSSNLIHVAWDPAQNTRPYVGAMDDVRIYSRALSDAEILSLYTAGAQ